MSYCAWCGRKLEDGEVCICSQPPVKKKNRKILFIIPEAIILIAILCIVFWPKNSTNHVPAWFDSAFRRNNLSLSEVSFDFIEKEYGTDYVIYSVSPDGNKLLGVYEEKTMFIADTKQKTITPVVKDLENSVETGMFAEGNNVFEAQPNSMLERGSVVWSPDGGHVTLVSYVASILQNRSNELTLIDTTTGSWRALEECGEGIFLDTGIIAPISACFNDKGTILYYIKYDLMNEVTYTLKLYDLRKDKISVLAELPDYTMVGWDVGPGDTLIYYKGAVYYNEAVIHNGDDLRLRKVFEEDGEWVVDEIPIVEDAYKSMNSHFQIADNGRLLIQTEFPAAYSMSVPDYPKYMLMLADSPEEEMEILTTIDYTEETVGKGEYSYRGYPKLKSAHTDLVPAAVSMSPDGEYALVNMISETESHLMLLSLKNFKWKELEIEDADLLIGSNGKWEYPIRWLSGNRIVISGIRGGIHLLEFVRE